MSGSEGNGAGDTQAPRGFSVAAIAAYFQSSELTPLLAFAGVLLGLLAILITPREEEPQIDVTFANVLVPFPGASADEVEHLVSTPAEQVLSEIEGVEHVYSVSRPGLAVLSVQFYVGEARTGALVRLYNQVLSNADWLPRGLGVGEPVIKPKGIDDVPVVTLTLWSADTTRGAADLLRVAHALEADLKSVPGTRNIYTVGGPDNVLRVTLDPIRMAGHGVTVGDIKRALLGANALVREGTVTGDGETVDVQVGQFLVDAVDVAALTVGARDGAAVRLGDVASVAAGPDEPARYVWYGKGAAAGEAGAAARGEFPAVTIAIAKQPGRNAVDVSRQVIARVDALRGIVIPDGVEVTVTRDYGQTANDKANTLIKKLVFATASVVLLVLVTLGWRAALVVGTAVMVTLMITLFASWAWGFTINRVSLFALIFSIGILVDDAIVVVENIYRHLRPDGPGAAAVIPRAVSEVGGPTILATLTVIAALLPMAFVTGLMGPYMSPIPINASMGMLISLAVALVLTPWLALHLLRPAAAHHGAAGSSRLSRLFGLLIGPFLASGARRVALLVGVLALLAGAVALVPLEAVVLKMLPFDNKSEFQVVLDMPEGTTLERTAGVLGEMADAIAAVPEVVDYQVYAGTAAPIGFNGLVRQYYLRRAPELGDIQVNLTPKHTRKRKSHDVAGDVRALVAPIAAAHGGAVVVAEVPPGPPVQAPLVAEIYGLDASVRERAAERVRALFAATPDVVDIDDSRTAPSPKTTYRVDTARAALLGVPAADAVDAIGTALLGDDVSFLHGGQVKYPVPVRLRFADADRVAPAQVLALRARSRTSGGDTALVPLSSFVNAVEGRREAVRYHKDLLPYAFVTGDAAGRLDSPLYAMFSMRAALEDMAGETGERIRQFLFQPPAEPFLPAVKWDGEWRITWQTFRDMGAAYAVGLLLIYLLVVAQFRSYAVPLIIMAPIPLTVIGVLPGHALLGAQFTATSMIGLIALAGIIVRNSILLVSFVDESRHAGMPLAEAVIESAAVRAKPIVLTGLAAMLGALFIIDDPIFSGLAVSLLSGILVSTLLTLVVIPVMYYRWLSRG